MIMLLIFSNSPVQSQSANFDIRLIINGAVPHHDTLAHVIKQNWASLLVDVSIEGVPQPVYNDQIADRNFDMAIFSLDQVWSAFPPIWETYSPSSIVGSDFFDMKNTALMNSANINLTHLNQLTDDYQSSNNVTSKMKLAKEFQQFYNDEVLLDIPLTSETISLLSWNAFEGLDHEEGILGSLFLGAGWASNPEERAEAGRGMSELHYAVRDFGGIKNPIYYQTRGDLILSETLFPTLFKVDKNDHLHPDLAIAYNKTLFENGTSLWSFHLREDALWSDGEIVDAYDVKFTYDLISFDWVGATSHRDWDNLSKVTAHNSTTLDVIFNESSLIDPFKFATEFVIPEHVLNQSEIYDGVFPGNIAEWLEFIYHPVTAGPFEYDREQSSDNVEVFTQNPGYWYPNEKDSPNGIFNLKTGETGQPYYFNFDEDPKLRIDTLNYHLITLESVDDGSLYISYESGQKDIIELDYFVGQNEILSNDKLRVDSIPVDGSGLVLLINLQKPILQEYEIRKALNQALNRDDILKVVGYGQITQMNPVSVFYTDYYNAASEIEPSIDDAKETFQQFGFEVLLNTEGNEDFEWPWQRLPINPYVVILTMIGLGMMVRVRRGKE